MKPRFSLNKKILAGLGMVLVCLFLAVFVDRPMAQAIASLPQRSATAHRFWQDVTHLGDSSYYLIPFFLLFLTLRYAGQFAHAASVQQRLRHGARICLFLFSAVAASALTADALKVLAHRPRPKLFLTDGLYELPFTDHSAPFLDFSGSHSSFPSGHTCTIVSLAMACSLLWPRWWFFYWPLALVVAISRVVVGSHYPSDVVAGAFVAMVITLYVKKYFLARQIDIFAKTVCVHNA